MDDNKKLTVGELGEKLKSLEQEISGWAKSGIRAYTPDELLAYKASLTLIDFLESKDFIDGKRMRDYWLLHAPTQHRTIKELKPIDAKGDETEVFDKVIEKISKGDGDLDDDTFVKEVEKRLGFAIITKDISGEIKSFVEKRDAIKKKIVANL